jgi:hypothetical protein
LTLPNYPTGGPHEREVFDQTWAIADPSLIRDETYRWTVEGVETELHVAGRSLLRTRGPAHDLVVTMVTTTRVQNALAAGETTAAQALASGDLVLSGPAEAIQRMFIVPALPGGV